MTENELLAALAAVQERLPERPASGLVLGSGLGALADELAQPRVVIPFHEVPGFARETVEGHGDTIVCGRLEGVPCIALQGRRHLYEGYTPAQVALPVRLLVRLGIDTLILTNAAGGIDPTFRAGDLMIIDDHINLLWRSPLAGPVVDGEIRFPDMSAPYDPALQKLAEEVALTMGVRTVRGVYCAVTGPSYETPAEIRMLARLGAHAVGMSTVPETIAARAAGAAVLGISLISNPAAGRTVEPLSHEEVIAAAARAAGDFARVVRGVVARIGGGELE